MKGIVHHKTYLNDENIYNPEITLNENKLEGICINCHNREHFKKNNAIRNDVMFDENGNLIKK